MIHKWKFIYVKLLTKVDGQSLQSFIISWIASLLVQPQYLGTLYFISPMILSVGIGLQFLKSIWVCKYVYHKMKINKEGFFQKMAVLYA